MPRDHHVRRALALQRDPSLPPSLELTEGLCAVARPDGAMKERIERRSEPLPSCRGGCAVRRFFERAAAEGADVELDVGAGYGRFVRAHAAANPGIRVLAIEQESARVARSDVISRRAPQAPRRRKNRLTGGREVYYTSPYRETSGGRIAPRGGRTATNQPRKQQTT